MVTWHNLSIESAFTLLDSRPDGLNETTAADRLKQVGSNQLKTRKPISPLKIFFKQFANYFIIVLLFAAGLAYWVSFMPGQAERRLTSYFILVIILLSVLLSFFEEYRSQRELEALSRLLVFRTAVLREGVRKKIDAGKVVPGDVMVLSQGQKVPADGRIFESHSLRVLVSYAVTVGLQLLALYTPLRFVFGVVPLDWRAWLIMITVTAGSSFFGVYMTRWILKLVPLWDEPAGENSPGQMRI
jgi:hypothetical protein